MSVFEFSRLPAYRRNGSQERLLRAAVYAFCTLPRPSRREIAQLDDLALPLIEKASLETRRYVAAALSEVAEAPPALVRRLCDEPVAVAAPLLLRSRELCDIDLIALIGRHGMGHARAIAGRANLNPRIAKLISALEALDTSAETGRKADMPDRAEETRQKLREMMVPAEPSRAPTTASEYPTPLPALARWRAAPGAFDKLRSAALTGLRELFGQTLARTLGISLAQGEALASEHGLHDLPIALRALELRQEEAFLLAACLFGSRYAHPEAIRHFLDRFTSVSVAAARDTVRDWKMSAIPGFVDRHPDVEWEDAQIPPAANQDMERPAADTLLKVS
ncbi:MAG: hypothetical protein ACXIVF_10505 [Rhizobiaceae bacterium]